VTTRKGHHESFRIPHIALDEQLACALRGADKMQAQTSIFVCDLGGTTPAAELPWAVRIGPETHGQISMTVRKLAMASAASNPQVTAVVRKAISGTEGTPDWSTILEILGRLEASPAVIPRYISAIVTLLSTGSQAAKMNSIILVDALFKNSKREALSGLQLPSLFRSLSDPGIANNPDLRNFLFKCTPSWVSSCASQNCLDSSLSTFQQLICRERFVPNLSEHCMVKLFKDLEVSADILGLLAEIISTSVRQGTRLDTPVLAEILPNVREVSRRLMDLEELVEVPDLQAAISAQRQFSLICQQFVSDIKAGKSVPLDRLALGLTHVQQTMDKRRIANAELVEKSRPRRRKRPGDDEMSTDEFFRRFQAIKGRAEPALIDLGQPSATDSLIDSLIDL